MGLSRASRTKASMSRQAPVAKRALLSPLESPSVAVGTIPELLALDHPWIQEYFNGPRGRAAEDSAGRDAAYKSAIGPATGSGDDGGMTD